MTTRAAVLGFIDDLVDALSHHTRDQPRASVTPAIGFANRLARALAWEPLDPPDVYSGGFVHISRRPITTSDIKQADHEGIERLSVASLAASLAASAPATRLRRRAAALGLVQSLESGLALAAAHAMSRAIAESLAIARAHYRSLEHTHAHTRLTGALMPVLALDLASQESSDLARQLEDVLDFAPDSITPYMVAAFDRAQDLEESLKDSRYDLLDLFERVYARAQVLVDALAIARDEAMDIAQGHATKFTNELPTAIDMERLKSNDLERLRAVVNDLTGADLHDANLDGVLLDGVRWSDTTRWPEEWAQRIWGSSVSLGSGVYEYRPGTTKAGDLVGASR